MVWNFLLVGERGGIHSVSTNDFVCYKDGQKRTELCWWFKAFNWLENSTCCPRVDQVLRSAEAFFYQQMISLWFERFLRVGERAGICIDQLFCLLEGWSEEDRAMLMIQSVQLTWKLNLLPTCWSGTPFCWGLLLSTNNFNVVWTFHQVGERAGIHSVSTNDVVCWKDGQKRTELCCWFKAFNWLENSICCPCVNQVLHSAEAFFYQQMILSWFGRFIELGREREFDPFIVL